MSRLSFGPSGERGAPVAIFGVAPGGPVSPASGQVVLSAELAEDTGLKAGDRGQVSGREFTVAGTGGASSYNHSPVAWIGLEDWRALDQTGGGQTATVVDPLTALGAAR